LTFLIALKSYVQIEIIKAAFKYFMNDLLNICKECNCPLIQEQIIKLSDE